MVAAKCSELPTRQDQPQMTIERLHAERQEPMRRVVGTDLGKVSASLGSGSGGSRTQAGGLCGGGSSPKPGAGKA